MSYYDIIKHLPGEFRPNLFLLASISVALRMGLLFRQHASLCYNPLDYE